MKALGLIFGILRYIQVFKAPSLERGDLELVYIPTIIGV